MFLSRTTQLGFLGSNNSPNQELLILSGVGNNCRCALTIFAVSICISNRPNNYCTGESKGGSLPHHSSRISQHSDLKHQHQSFLDIPELIPQRIHCRE